MNALFGYTKLMNDRRINELCKKEPIYILQQTVTSIDNDDRIYFSTTNKFHLMSFMEDNNISHPNSLHNAAYHINEAVDKGTSTIFSFDHAQYAITIKENLPMIVNHSPTQVTQVNDRKVISYGTSSYGYDIRVDRKFKQFKKPAFSNDKIAIDPKLINPEIMREYECHDDFIIIPANSFVLANTVESFNIPPNVLVNCIGKSTYARCGIICIVTPLEPGWSGYLTLEFANTTDRPVKLYVEEGVAQLEFYESLFLPDITYADRNGKYQNQSRQPVMPRLK